MCHKSWQCFLSWHWTNCPCKPKCLDSSRLLCGLLNTNVAFPPAITLPVSVAQLSQWGKSCQVLQALVFGVWHVVWLCPSAPRLFFFFFFFQFRNVVPACYRSTKSLVFCPLPSRSDFPLCSASPLFVSTLTLYPHCWRSAQQGCAAAAAAAAAAAQSAVTTSCK